MFENNRHFWSQFFHLPQRCVNSKLGNRRVSGSILENFYYVENNHDLAMTGISEKECFFVSEIYVSITATYMNDKRDNDSKINLHRSGV